MRGPTELCGLRVNGALSPVGRPCSGPADLVMEPGRVGAVGVLDGIEPDSRGMSFHQDGEVLFVRFHGLADAVVDMGTGTAAVDVCATAPPGMAEVLAAGPVLALALALRGQPCLHASAVSIGGQALAFAAPSGGGKSTLAALACLGGAELVADDILALDLAEDGSQVRCLPGSPELRLRPAPAELLADAPWPRRTTADRRVAVLAGAEELASPRLAAIVLPMISADRGAGVERLRGAAASTALLACARVASLQTEHHKTMLEMVTTLAVAVPVYRVTLPRLTSPAIPGPVQGLLDEHLGTPRESGFPGQRGGLP